MSLTSTIVWALEQPDGRKLVQEQHTDTTGKVYPRFYTAAAGADLDANAAAYAALLEGWLADREAQEITQ